MRTTNVTKDTFSTPSLTDTILGLCASGRFGVREAIAAASQKQSQQKQAQSSAQARRKAA